jgi:PKD repeat protein
MKKRLLFISLLAISLVVNGQYLFLDDLSTQTSTQGLGDPNTNFYLTYDLDNASTLDSAIFDKRTWKYANFGGASVGRGYWSSSIWTSGNRAASDYLVLKSPINLTGKVKPSIKFDYYLINDSTIVELRIATSIAGTTPVASDFNSATILWTSNFNETNKDWKKGPTVDLSSYTGNVYLAFIHKSTSRVMVGISNIIVKSKITNDIEFVSTSLDSTLLSIDMDHNLPFSQYNLFNCGDTAKSFYTTIKNVGTSTINSFSYSYSYGDSIVSETKTGVSIAADSFFTFLSKPCKFNGNDLYALNIGVGVSGDTLTFEDSTNNYLIVTQTPYKINSTDKFTTSFEMATEDLTNLNDEFSSLQSRFLRGTTPDVIRTLYPTDFSGSSQLDVLAHTGNGSLASFITTASAQSGAGITTNWWYITPCLNFDMNKKYYISFWANPLGSAPISIRSGNSQSILGMTNSIATGSVSDTVWKETSITFSPTSSGPQNIGFNYTGRWYFFMDDVEIGELTPPDAAFDVITDDAGYSDYDSLVTFTNNSSGKGTLTYKWDFGVSSSNTDTSSRQFPSGFKYPKQGTYIVRLIVSNAAGSDTQYITVTVKPFEIKPNFTATVSGLKIVFNNTTTPNLTSNQYQWDFGDGTGVSTQKNPTYTYKTAGTYNVCLTASNYGVSNDYCKEFKLTGSSINIVESPQDQIVIYPNPSKDGRFTISSSTTTPLNVNITDILGKTVYSQNLGTISKQVINLGNVQNGVYFIEINNGSSTTIQKLIMDK